MPLPDTFTQNEVNNAVGELKACLDDAKEWGSFNELEKNLPRFAYLFRNDPVLVYLLDELPASGIEQSNFRWDFPPEPRTRLSKQIAVLIAVGEGTLDLWSFSEFCFGKRNDFWDEIYYPAIRDILRYVTSAQKEFTERKKLNSSSLRSPMSTPKNYALDLFISHSSKDKRVAKALIEFLRAALAILPERVRCTSVDGYKLSAGAKTEAGLRKEIQNSCCFIGLITPASMKSQFALFEWGARWGSDEHFVPLLARGIKAGALRPPLSSLNALNCASKNEMEQLVHDLAKVLKKGVSLPAIYKAQLSSLMKLKKD